MTYRNTHLYGSHLTEKQNHSLYDFPKVSDLFTEEQKKIMRDRFVEIYNYVPVVCLRSKKNLSTYILTTLITSSDLVGDFHGNTEYAYGLYSYKTARLGADKQEREESMCSPDIMYQKEMGIGRILLHEAARIAREMDDELYVDQDFVGQYNLAVYACVAFAHNSILCHHDNCPGFFRKYAKGMNIDPNADLTRLKRKLVWQ